ncbi:M3 family metallopeptidase [Derxia lacustris]|uniref:M3 family metallopeptidase n=1 Tax=Derxia lacustris TaxID=764842 RepID=UPI000A1701CA|nr:M3 family metallopeptidase [Derxia lacustris]
MSITNPLLDFSGLPRFGDIRPEHITPAIEALLAECKATVETLEAPGLPASWDSFVTPLDDATERLGRAWGIVGHLNSVVDTPEQRAAYNENLPRVTEFWTALSQNEALYAKYKALRASPEFDTLAPARKKIVENSLRDFRLGGAELTDAAKERFAAIQERQAELSQKFSEHVLDATNAWSLLIEDEAELAGLPDDAKQAARERAEQDGKPGYKFTLHFPSYFPVLQYADKRELREQIYRANATRASEFGPAELDNTPLMKELLALRAEEAALLGYASFAEVSLVPKMAETPAEVEGFLRDLAARAKPYAQRDVQELQAFAKVELGLDELKPWDVAYASEKLREKRYSFSEQELKQYFPEPKALGGLFRVIETLFGVRVKPDEAPVWHPDVRFHRIEALDGRLLGQFYIDLYAREGKRSGAWMDDARGRRLRPDGSLQTPVTYLTCNFSAPVGGKPAVFTHDEVLTLFHEFGHGLHHMLTRVEELGVAGINGVEWDAVELPSQFMENFCWEWEVLSHMTGHVDTGAPLPRALYDKMIAAKNFQAGMQTVRQIEFSLFDMLLHGSFDPAGEVTIQQLLDAVREEVAVLVPPPFNRFQNSFSHIFAGGYAAGYYSYKWAEVLSADAYGKFEEHGGLNPATGAEFLETILSVGGSRPALDSFVAFRGRKPSIDALLRHNGMAEPVAA